MSQRQALATLAALLLVMAWFAQGAASPSSVPIVAEPGQATDVQLYQAIIKRVHDGQGYYDAVGIELRARDYPVRPFFNWRPPTYAILLGRLPSIGWGGGILLITGAWTISLALLAFGMRAAGGLATVVATALVPVAVVFQETWASYFIALGLCLYALDRWRLAMAALLVALAFREFALLPCVVALVLAWRDGRRPECRAWLIALSVYVLLMVAHAVVVTRHLQPADQARSWVSMGGSGFLIASAAFTPLLMFLPSWAVALAFPCALLGLAGWRGPAGTRIALTMAGYVIVFSFIGLRFNSYWGIIYAPLLSLGIARAPESLRDLYQSLLRPREVPVTQPG
jgi:hypothetical protein